MRVTVHSILCLLLLAMPTSVISQQPLSPEQVLNQIGPAIENLGANPPPPGSAPAAGSDCMPSGGISLLGVAMESPNIPKGSISRLRTDSPLRQRIDALDAQIVAPANQQASLQRDSDYYARQIQTYEDSVNVLMWGLSRIPSNAGDDDSYTFNNGSSTVQGSRKDLRTRLNNSMQALAQSQQAFTQAQANLSRVNQQLDKMRAASALAYQDAVNAASKCP